MNILDSSLNSDKSNLLYEYTHGVDLDSKIYHEEILVQKAWAKSLWSIEFIDEVEYQKVISGLDEVHALMESNQFEWSKSDEDIHMNIESFITKKYGEIGKKMHFGRSRNDLIATTLRLKVASDLKKLEQHLKKMLHALKGLAFDNKGILVPGMTHLQHARPVEFEKIIGFHIESFKKDLSFLNFLKAEVLDEMPLGSGAMNGTCLKIDLNNLAKDLGFKQGPQNSYYMVGGRDFLLQAIYLNSQIGLHFSRLSEDIIFWNSTAVAMIKLGDNWSTGSSIMPNKRNPDVAELTRGKSSQLIGHLMSSFSLLKSLGSSYFSDLHELKRVYLDSLTTIEKIFTVFPSFIQELDLDKQKANELLNTGHIQATDIADQMVLSGELFREAYYKVAQMVKQADDKGVQVHEL